MIRIGLDALGRDEQPRAAFARTSTERKGNEGGGSRHLMSRREDPKIWVRVCFVRVENG